ncbi:MAG: hypothetical protein NZM37_04320, partial [Sandaracinaceae bacterium]|nr:hypothetical protein [Sandaracinaceae bacterium]
MLPFAPGGSPYRVQGKTQKSKKSPWLLVFLLIGVGGSLLFWLVGQKEGPPFPLLDAHDLLASERRFPPLDPPLEKSISIEAFFDAELRSLRVIEPGGDGPLRVRRANGLVVRFNRPMVEASFVN